VDLESVEQMPPVCGEGLWRANERGDVISVASKGLGEAQERLEKRPQCGPGFSDSGSGGRRELQCESVFHR